MRSRAACPLAGERRIKKLCTVSSNAVEVNMAIIEHKIGAFDDTLGDG